MYYNITECFNFTLCDIMTNKSMVRRDFVKMEDKRVEGEEEGNLSV